MTKRGQIDFRLPLIVLTAAAAFVITAIVVILTIGTVNDANVFGGAPTVAQTVTNESKAYVNTTGYTLSGYNNSWSGITIDNVWANITGDTPVAFVLLLSGNYTVSTVGVLTNSTPAINVTQWNNATVSYHFTQTTGAAPLGQLATGNLTGNLTGGVNTIAAKLPTVFIVIAIILVLSAIAILVEVWRRFSGGGGGGTFG